MSESILLKGWLEKVRRTMKQWPCVMLLCPYETPQSWCWVCSVWYSTPPILPFPYFIATQLLYYVIVNPLQEKQKLSIIGGNTNRRYFKIEAIEGTSKYYVHVKTTTIRQGFKIWRLKITSTQIMLLQGMPWWDNIRGRHRPPPHPQYMRT